MDVEADAGEVEEYPTEISRIWLADELKKG
jgi:hypothetical protein